MRNLWAATSKKHIVEPLNLSLMIVDHEVCFGLETFVLNVDTQQEGSFPKWKCVVKLKQQVVGRTSLDKGHFIIRAAVFWLWAGIRMFVRLCACVYLVANSSAPPLNNAKHTHIYHF